MLNKQKYHGASLPVLYDCISFRKIYGIYSYLLLILTSKCMALDYFIIHGLPYRIEWIYLITVLQ